MEQEVRKRRKMKHHEDEEQEVPSDTDFRGIPFKNLAQSQPNFPNRRAATDSRIVSSTTSNIQTKQ
jgi:hypothetical protein